jgi:uncharacterized protein
MTGPIRVIYRKYDGSLHWHMEAEWLGEDEHGVWLGTRQPTTMRKGDGPLVELGHASVMLFPRESWWTAAFNPEPAAAEIYCDITTPTRWPSANEVTMVDLDLDVIRLRTGEVILDDEDEFAEHRQLYRYPAEVVAEAERSARWLMSAVAEGREPFASTYRSYLELVTSADG